MDDPRIVDWLRLQRHNLSTQFFESAQSGEFPGYGELSPLALKAVTDRMARLLIYHADRDEESLQSTETLHRRQASLVTARIPILEKLAFIEERFALVRRHADEDPETGPFRDVLLKRIGEAARYAKITTRSVELDRKMAELSGE